MTSAMRSARAAAYPIRVPETRHRFELLQQVRLVDDEKFSAKHLSADGVYEVRRLMPCDQSGVFQYRVGSAAGERIVTEMQVYATDTLP